MNKMLIVEFLFFNVCIIPVNVLFRKLLRASTAVPSGENSQILTYELVKLLGSYMNESWPSGKSDRLRTLGGLSSVPDL